MSTTKKVEALLTLLPIAVASMDGSDPLTIDQHGEIQSEYLRGQAELICEACGLPMDSKSSLMALIVDLAEVEVCS